MRKVVFMFLLLPILGIAQNWEQIIIASGSDSSNPMFLTEFNGELYFTADDGVHGRELFKTDGTTISLVKDINVGSGSSSNHSENMMAMLEENGFLYCH